MAFLALDGEERYFEMDVIYSLFGLTPYQPIFRRLQLRAEVVGLIGLFMASNSARILRSSLLLSFETP